MSTFKAIMMAVLIIVLIIAFVRPITNLYKATLPLGEEESSNLTALKKSCEEKQTDGCALEVAKGTLEAEESKLIAFSWLKREVDFTNNNQVLVDSYKFAQTSLSPEITLCDLKDTYQKILQKIGNSDINVAADLRILLASIPSVCTPSLPVQG